MGPVVVGVVQHTVPHPLVPQHPDSVPQHPIQYHNTPIQYHNTPIQYHNTPSQYQSSPVPVLVYPKPTTDLSPSLSQYWYKSTPISAPVSVPGYLDPLGTSMPQLSTVLPRSQRQSAQSSG
eukprot:1399049-Rhodomonas_salina.1